MQSMNTAKTGGPELLRRPPEVRVLWLGLWFLIGPAAAFAVGPTVAFAFAIVLACRRATTFALARVLALASVLLLLFFSGFLSGSGGLVAASVLRYGTRSGHKSCQRCS
jgi:hypothetical protein